MESLDRLQNAAAVVRSASKGLETLIHENMRNVIEPSVLAENNMPAYKFAQELNQVRIYLGLALDELNLIP